MAARLALGLVILCFLALPGAAAAQSAPFAPWDGANPFRCTEQDVGTGTDYPDPDADPFCVRFDKTNQNVTGFGIVEFAAQEPARISAAAGKCFYFQRDEWTGSVVQGSDPELWHWNGRYFFDKAKGIGGVSVTDYRLGGVPQDATPFVPPEYRPYFDESGGGGVMFTSESEPDPGCRQMVDTPEEREAVYRDVPRFGECAPTASRIRARKIGGAKMGMSSERLEQKLGAPRRSSRGTDRWCLIGEGSLRVGYSDGEVMLVRSTHRGHAKRDLAPGAPVADAREEISLRRRFRQRGKNVVEAPRKHGRRLFAAVRDGRIRWVAMTDERVLDSNREVARALRRAG